MEDPPLIKMTTNQSLYKPEDGGEFPFLSLIIKKVKWLAKYGSVYVYTYILLSVYIFFDIYIRYSNKVYFTIVKVYFTSILKCTFK